MFERLVRLPRPDEDAEVLSVSMRGHRIGRKYDASLVRNSLTKACCNASLRSGKRGGGLSNVTAPIMRLLARIRLDRYASGNELGRMEDETLLYANSAGDIG